MNRVELTGGLTRDGEFTAGEHPRLQFTIAVNGTRYDSTEGKQVVKAAYITCVAWEVQAALWNGLKKGDEVHVVGELDQYRKEGKEDQTPSTRVTVLSMSMIRESRAHRAAAGAGDDPWK